MTYPGFWDEYEERKGGDPLGRLRHASVELVEAMRGTPPPVEYVGPAVAPVCRARYAEPTLWARAGTGDTVFQPDGLVDCPACLALMDEARGPERLRALAIHADELELKRLADHQKKAEAEMTKEALISKSPHCDQPLSNAGWKPCGNPMLPIEHADWNHRANIGDRLVCLGCGGGRRGTDAEVAASRKVAELAP